MTTQTENKKSGIVYILTNESMPGIIKIGLTTGDIKTRMTSLYDTGVPLPFELYHSELVNDCQQVEKILHSLFSDERVNIKREFFKVDPEKVVKALELCNYTVEKIMPIEINTTLDNYDIAAINKAKSQRANININKLVDVGSILTFTKDDSITAIVLENNKIEMDGKTMTISGAAKLLTGAKTIRGSIFWKYNGETLNEIRNRIENFEE